MLDLEIRHREITRDAWARRPPFRRAVHTTWHRRVGSTKRHIPSDGTTPQPNDMHLYPTRSQGGEMLQCAKEVAERTPGRRLSYTEFCAYPKELKRPNDRHPRQLGKIQDRNGQEKKKKSRKMSKTGMRHDLFLGGSCNPTTWRQDVAIPLLDSFGISYYNPQVSEWSSELIAVEHRAKASARLLFYVLDRQTRNIVGIVEAAHFAGSSRHLVLVIDHYLREQLVAGEHISNQEFDELSGGLATLQDLLERQGIPVFTSIKVAINHTAKSLRDKHDKEIKMRNSPSKLSHVQVGDKYFKLREVFDEMDKTGSGEISLSDFHTAYTLLTNKKLRLSDLSGILGDRKGESMGSIKINFEQFCAMVAELKIQNGTTEKWVACCSRVASASASARLLPLDIYVGGSCFDVTWKHQIAIPLLEESGLRYKLAECGSESSSRATPAEMDAMDMSRILLFVITSNIRGLATMALASYYIGLGRNVVLCIQQLPEGCCIANEKLTEIAINDYNRGRFYLADEARRLGVPVVDNVAEAVRTAIARCS